MAENNNDKIQMKMTTNHHENETKSTTTTTSSSDPSTSESNSKPQAKPQVSHFPTRKPALKRRRSALFGDLGGSTSTASQSERSNQHPPPPADAADKQNLSSAGTFAFSSKKNETKDESSRSASRSMRGLFSQAGPRRRGISTGAASSASSSSSSLFGAVMKKFSSPTNASTQEEKEAISASSLSSSDDKGLGCSAAATKQKGQKGDMNTEDDTTTTFTSTPQKSFSSSSSSLFASATASNLHQNDDDHNNNHSNSGTPTTKSNLLFSPKGNTVLDFVNQMVMNSPFKFQSPLNKKGGKKRSSSSSSMISSPATAAASASSTATSPSAATSTTRQPKRRRLNWGTGSSNNNNSSSSLRNATSSKYTFDPSDSSSSSFDDWRVISKVHMDTTTTTTTSSTGSSGGGPARSIVRTRQFQQALQVWQYNPGDVVVTSTKQLQQPLRESSSSQSKNAQVVNSNHKKNLSSKAASSSTNTDGGTSNSSATAKELEQWVLQHKAASGAATTTSSGNSSKQQKQQHKNAVSCYRWQEAFRSVYHHWCRAVDDCTDDSGASNKNHHHRNPSDVYFYCLSRDHSVVFRMQEIKPQQPSTEEDEDDGHNQVICFQPTATILIGRSREFADQLEHELSTFGWKNETDNHSDATLGNNTPEQEFSSPTKNITKQNQNSNYLLSPNVKDDLEALRRAQVYGQTAGADVSVKVGALFQNKTKASQLKFQPTLGDHPARVRPLTFTGMDQVSLFWEVYLNLHGPSKLLSGRELPSILCRKVGPFEHATQVTLQHSLSQDMENLAHDKILLESSSSSNGAALAGTVMIPPCSIRDVVRCLLVDNRRQTSRRQEHDEEVATASKPTVKLQVFYATDEIIGVGSHLFNRNE